MLQSSVTVIIIKRDMVCIPKVSQLNKRKKDLFHSNLTIWCAITHTRLQVHLHVRQQDLLGFTTDGYLTFRHSVGRPVAGSTGVGRGGRNIGSCEADGGHSIWPAGLAGYRWETGVSAGSVERTAPVSCRCDRCGA